MLRFAHPTSDSTRLESAPVLAWGVTASFSHAMTGRQHMAQQRTAEVSEAEIAVHWQEEDYVNPPEKFVAQANLNDPKVFERFSLDNFPGCFKEYADLLD